MHFSRAGPIFKAVKRRLALIVFLQLVAVLRSQPFQRCTENFILTNSRYISINCGRFTPV